VSIRPVDAESSSSNKGLPRIRPWRELVLIAAIVAELSWVALWYRVLFQAGRQVSYLRVLVILLIMLMVFFIPSRVMIYLNTRLSLRRVILFLLFLANYLLGLRALLYTREPVGFMELLNRPVRSFSDMANLIPTEFIVMLFVLLVSWRGIAYSDRQVGPVNVLASFRLGVFMFILYGLALPIIQGSPSTALYIFLFTSLLAMSTARISVLSQLRGGHHILFNRQWAAGIISVILIIVGISALVVSFASKNLFDLLSTLLTWLMYLVVLIFTPLAWLLMRLLFWLFEMIRLDTLFDALRDVFQRLDAVLRSIAALIAQFAQSINLEFIESFFARLASYKSIYLWMIIILGLMVMLLTLRRVILKDERADDQDVESSLAPQDLFNLLKAALRRGLGRLAGNLEEILRLNQARRLLAAARIRRIYAQLLRLSAKLDHPRPASRTPLEFLPALESLFPALSTELETITDAYLLVRYGEAPETSEELGKVETAWKAVFAAGQESLRIRHRAAK